MADKLHEHLGKATIQESLTSNFEDFYKLERKLISGSYGTVYVGVDIRKGSRYAVKIVDRRWVIMVDSYERIKRSS